MNDPLHQTNGLTADGDLTMPIHTSVQFAMKEPSSDAGLQYGRIGNRTRMELARIMCAVHGTQYGDVTGSGSAAITAVALLLAKGGVIMHHAEMYEGTRRIFRSVMAPFGVTTISCDLTNLSLVKRMLKNHAVSLLWIETPTNPSFRILDIKRLTALARGKGAISCTDTTMCSGIIQQPIRLGSDIVVESLTKAINGHSDALGGFVGTNDAALGRRLQAIIQTAGMVLSPWESSLILRGIKTAQIRIKAQQRHAQRIRTWLTRRHDISLVMAPGWATTGEMALLKTQMRGKGALLSFEVAPTCDPGRFIRALQRITICHSFGGTETVIQQPAEMMDFTGDKSAVPSARLFRLSVGLEPPEDIIGDLSRALEHCS